MKKYIASFIVSNVLALAQTAPKPPAPVPFDAYERHLETVAIPQAQLTTIVIGTPAARMRAATLEEALALYRRFRRDEGKPDAFYINNLDGTKTVVLSVTLPAPDATASAAVNTKQK